MHSFFGDGSGQQFVIQALDPIEHRILTLNDRASVNPARKKMKFSSSNLTFGHSNSILFYSLLCAAFSAFIICLNIQNQFVLDFDSWAYWEGSLSLLNGDGYFTLKGTRITAWPPLFSSVLAIWQSIFGNTLGAVKLLFVFLGFCTAFIYSWTAQRVIQSKLICLMVLIIFVCYTPTAYTKLHSESLWILLIAMMTFIMFLHRNSNLNAVLAVLFAALLLCRNISIALGPGLLLWLFISNHCRIDKNLVSGAIALIIGGLVWIAFRVILDSSGSHTIEFTDLKTIMFTLKQNWDSLIESFFVSKLFVSVVGATLLVLMLLRRATDTTLKSNLSYVCFALVYFAAISTILTLVKVPPGQLRFIIPIFAIIILVISSGKDIKVFSTLRLIFLALVLMSLAYRTVYFTYLNLNKDTSNHILDNSFVLSEDWIDQTLIKIDNKLESGNSIKTALTGTPISYNTYLKWKLLPLVSAKDNAL